MLLIHLQTMFILFESHLGLCSNGVKMLLLSITAITYLTVKLYSLKLSLTLCKTRFYLA